jgi:O-antigen/teichoic acid export membrane protein
MTAQTAEHAEATTEGLAATIGRHTALGIIANLAQIGTRLFTVPIVIASLGLEGYGVWNVLMMTAMYMRFGGIGIKSAFQKYVAEATGDNDYFRASTLLSTGCAVMLVISVAALIPAALFSAAIAKTVGVPAEFLPSAAPSISVLAVIMLLANTGAAFEAIVMGGHRIDLIRKANVVLSIAEAIGTVIALRRGGGLLTMSAIMGVSEVLYVCYCYVAAHRVLPQIRVNGAHLTFSVLPELFRFAGSYQLVNILEVVYASIVPIALLRAYGPQLAGVYAVVTRVVTSAAILQDSFLAPILSSGSMVYALASRDRMQRFLVSAFRATLGLSILPMGFIAVFGPTAAYAWTSQRDSLFVPCFWLVCATAVFKAPSLVGLVLYRTSGKSVLDNVRQVLRIGIVGAVAALAPHLDFREVLAGFAISECAGMLFMLFALNRTFRLFQPLMLLPDTIKLGVSTALALGAALLVSNIPLPFGFSERTLAAVTLAIALVAYAIAAFPLLLLTGSLTAGEGRTLIQSVLPVRFGLAARSRSDD